jgi:hypothetical protein
VDFEPTKRNSCLAWQLRTELAELYEILVSALGNCIRLTARSLNLPFIVLTPPHAKVFSTTCSIPLQFFPMPIHSHHKSEENPYTLIHLPTYSIKHQRSIPSFKLFTATR